MASALEYPVIIQDHHCGDRPMHYGVVEPCLQLQTTIETSIALTGLAIIGVGVYLQFIKYFRDTVKAKISRD